MAIRETRETKAIQTVDRGAVVVVMTDKEPGAIRVRAECERGGARLTAGQARELSALLLRYADEATKLTAQEAISRHLREAQTTAPRFPRF